jgi:phospholipase A-2-activating protein
MSRLPAIVKVLKETSFYHTSKLADADMALLVKILKSWPPQMMFPGIYPLWITRLYILFGSQDVLAFKYL